MAEATTYRLERTRFHGAEFRRQIYVADVEQSHAPEAVLDPAYWANVAAQLQPFDRIEVRCEDGTWLSELLVLEVGRAYVKCKQLNHYKLTTADVGQTQAEPGLASGFQAVWRGMHHKFAVKRLSDNEWIQQGFPSKLAAEEFIREHIKALA